MFIWRILQIIGDVVSPVNRTARYRTVVFRQFGVAAPRRAFCSVITFQFGDEKAEANSPFIFVITFSQRPR
jgi:hypothetical protein